jgi:hypothetical protein
VLIEHLGEAVDVTPMLNRTRQLTTTVPDIPVPGPPWKVQW